MNSIAQPQRYALIDIARGVALVAMATYHLGFDLTLFGYAKPEFATTGPMRTFARLIASSFLILVGVSLVLGHGKSIRWRGFWRRWLAVAACAALITAATWYAMPQAFIYFGILHHIALASLIGLLFVGLSWPVTLTAALAVMAIGLTVSSSTLDHPALMWTGLSATVRTSNDYVPLFPWFAAVLTGMAFAKSPAFAIVQSTGVTASSALARLLQWLGRRSLIVYMVHQPILIGLVYFATLIVPPAKNDDFTIAPDPFLDACESSCLSNAGADFCIAYCACMDVRLQQNDMKTPLIQGNLPVDDPAVVELTEQCTADIGDALRQLEGTSQ
ncbi:MAG: heparan-alpha-glucosaminide N-acetyltransferase [Pseudomonadota bacterium]